MARPQLRNTYARNKPEEAIDLHSFWFQRRRSRCIPSHLPADCNRNPGQNTENGHQKTMGKRRSDPGIEGWPGGTVPGLLMSVSCAFVCLLSRMFVFLCFLCFCVPQPAQQLATRNRRCRRGALLDPQHSPQPCGTQPF